jgi:hypothetical protein
MKLLKSNNVYDEKSYNKIKKNYDWLIDIGDILKFKKYPKFNFKMIHPNNKSYYDSKKDAERAYKKCDKKLS